MTFLLSVAVLVIPGRMFLLAIGAFRFFIRAVGRASSYIMDLYIVAAMIKFSCTLGGNVAIYLVAEALLDFT